MITGVAIVPGALLMLPEYVGRVDPMPALRAAARSNVDTVVAQADQSVIVCAGDLDARHTGPSAGERIGRLLLGERSADVMVVPADASVAECRAAGADLAARLGDAPTALVVVADGSATRTQKAPGHFDERSHAFDDALVAALRAVDLEALLHLDPVLAGALLVQGRAPLQVMAAALGERAAYRCAELLTADDFGVLHLVARLHRSTGPLT